MLTLLQFGGRGLFYWIDKGGWVMWPLTALLFLGILIAVERIWTLHSAKIRTAEFLQAVRAHLLGGRPEAAVAQCDEHPGAISRVVKAVLLRRAQGVSRPEMEKVAENAAIHEVGLLERRLWVIGLIANVAPILGFLGTVVGMIQSFDVLATEGMNNPSAVAAGISVALITTAGGLLVAVIVLPFYNWLTSRVGTFVNEIETAVNFLFEALEEARKAAPAGEPAAARA